VPTGERPIPAFSGDLRGPTGATLGGTMIKLTIFVLIQCCRSGTVKNHSGSGQSGSGMNRKKLILIKFYNYLNKMHNLKKDSFFKKKIP
jgi:hypothetical protein